MSLTGADAGLPTLSLDLIDELDKLFPARCIANGESLEDAHRYAGKRSVVDFLLSLRKSAADVDPSKPLLR